MSKRKKVQIAIIILLVAVIGVNFRNIYDYFNVTDGEKLEEAGFVTGNSRGDLLEEQVVIKAELIVSLIELNGEKGIAKEYSGDSRYEDVTERDWFYSYVAYAENKKWLTGEGNFEPESTVSTKFVEMMVLNQLGYKTQGVDKIDNLASIGIEIEAIDENAMTRAEVFKVLWQMVNTPKAESDIIFGRTIRSDFEGEVS